MSTAILSYLGWAFLPDLATNWIQTAVYAIFVRAGEPKPQPGTPRFVAHRLRIYIAVILSYLAYSLYEAHWEIRRAGDHYALLGVSPFAEDRIISSRFRRLSVQYHPDKLNPAPAHRPAVEAYYASLLAARDTLLDPVKRFAYDRFGPAADLSRCATIGECATAGLRAAAPTYLVLIGALVGFGLLGKLNWGSYWRWVALAGLAMLELRFAARTDVPALPAWATQVVPLLITRPYLPFQTMKFAHRAVIAVFVALSRVGPVLEALADPAQAARGSGSEEQQLAALTQRLEQLTGAANAEVARQLALEAVPFSGFDAQPAQREQAREKGFARLQTGLKDFFVTNQVRSDREVQQAARRVVEERVRANEVSMSGT